MSINKAKAQSLWADLRKHFANAELAASAARTSTASTTAPATARRCRAKRRNTQATRGSDIVTAPLMHPTPNR